MTEGVNKGVSEEAEDEIEALYFPTINETGNFDGKSTELGCRTGKFIPYSVSNSSQFKKVLRIIPEFGLITEKEAVSNMNIKVIYCQYWKQKQYLRNNEWKRKKTQRRLPWIG